MKLTKEQIIQELHLCLLEQGLDWYNDFNRAGLMLIGLYDVHEEDIKNIALEIR